MFDITETKTHLSVPELFRSIFSFYQKHLGSLWRVMIPIVLLSLFLQSLVLGVFVFSFPDLTWNVSTALYYSPISVTDSTFTITFSSLYFISLWFGLFLLVLTTFYIISGKEITVNDVLLHTYRKKGDLFMAAILCIAWCLTVTFAWILLQILLGFLFNFQLVVALNIFGFLFFLIYLFVRWSLIHQCIIIENLTPLRAFRRSGELVKGNWSKFFRLYLLLTWLSYLFSNLILAIVHLLLSYAVPEFLPMREKLLSMEILTLLFGIPVSLMYNNAAISVGEISIQLPHVTSFWALAVLDLVKAIVFVVLAPLWAILTTHLYLEQTQREDFEGETRANAIQAQFS